MVVAIIEMMIINSVIIFCNHWGVRVLPFVDALEQIGEYLIGRAYELQLSYRSNATKEMRAKFNDMPVFFLCMIYVIFLRQTFGCDRDIAKQHLETVSLNMTRILRHGSFLLRGALIPVVKKDHVASIVRNAIEFSVMIMLKCI